MITDEELVRLKAAAEKARDDKSEPSLELDSTWGQHEFFNRATPDAVLSLIESVEQAERDRDLAIAHDRQPYPTAGAYEKVCAALEKHKAANVTLRDSALEDAAKVAKDRADNSKVAYNCTKESRYLTDYQEAMEIYRVIVALKSTTVEGKSDD